MSTPRGPYAKTSAKRQKILEAALAAYEEAGSRSVSVRDIAQRVGMTDAGVLHHFGNREGLLTAVLEARDAEAVASFGDPIENPPAALEILAHNAATPGLVKLFVDVAAAAAEPEHPAHDFFIRRYERYRDGLSGMLARTAGSDTPAAPADRSEPDADWAARVLLAVTDGLQLQWLLKPDIDMAADLARLHSVLVDALRERTQDTP
ncbi:TetR/AcrR family transcriptional regulator [Streptomyces sp. NPDC033753]|uniref:TetR/AcrR family transcriptional regulator n=1 Tax=Streptomyces sp. NPDC033753 TaxID=3155128 RepID=UPI0033FF75F9